MAIGEFGGAPALPGSVLTSTPLYWLYETSHAALSPARVLADATKLPSKSVQSPLLHEFRQIGRRRRRNFRALDPPLCPARLADFFNAGRRRARAGPHHQCMGAAVLPASAFRACFRTRPAAAATAAADRRAAFGPLCDAAARHRRGFSALITMSISPSGAMRAPFRYPKGVSISTITSIT